VPPASSPLQVEAILAEVCKLPFLDEFTNIERAEKKRPFF